MTRLFKLFLLICLFLIGISIAAAAGLEGILPPGATDIIGVLTRWPAGPIEWLFVCAGVGGMVGHWLNQRRLGLTMDSFTDHFLMIDPHYMLATILLYWFAAMLVLNTVAIAAAKWPGAVIAGFALGWLFDSWISKKQA